MACFCFPCFSATILPLSSSFCFLPLLLLLPSSLLNPFLSHLIFFLLYFYILRLLESLSSLDLRRAKKDRSRAFLSKKVKLLTSLPPLFLKIEGLIKPSSYMLLNFKHSSEFIRYMPKCLSRSYRPLLEFQNGTLFEHPESHGK
jgi:hypothetical protein